MVYTKGYFEGAESTMLPVFFKDDDLEKCIKDEEIIYTITLDTNTKILLEAFLLISNIDNDDFRKRDFVQYTEKIGSPFKARCILMEQRFRMVKGFNTSRLELLFFICENADYFLDDKILIAGLEFCKSRVLLSKHLTANYLKIEKKETIYYVKEAGEDLPYWVGPLFTFANYSLKEPTIHVGQDNVFEDFPVDIEQELSGFLFTELKRLVNSLVNQMIFTIESYNQVIKLENIPAIVQRVVETVTLEHQCTNMRDLIIRLEEVLKCSKQK